MRTFTIIRCISKLGNLKWKISKTNDDIHQSFNDIERVSTGKFVVAGAKGVGGKALIFQVDSKGRTLWRKTYDLPGEENEVRSIVSTKNGNLIALMKYKIETKWYLSLFRPDLKRL